MINQNTGRINFNALNVINEENERTFWHKFILITIVTIPTICPNCNYKSISIYNNDSINNPVLGRCNSHKCRKTIDLRKNTLLDYFPRTPASIVFKVIYIWIYDKKNCKEIVDKLNIEITNYTIIKDKVLEILKVARYYIANYLRHVYIIKEFFNINQNERYAINESLFANILGNQFWLIGIINTASKEFRLEFIRQKTEEILKN